MRILVVEPGYAPYEKKISCTLKAQQSIVGGRIQALYPYEDSVALICNDDALNLGLPFNRSIENGYGAIFGTFFICGLSEDNFRSLSDRQVKIYKEKFKNAELLLAAENNSVCTMVVAAPIKAKIKEEPKPPKRDAR